MEGALLTATAEVLTNVHSTTVFANQCINAITAAPCDIDPVLLELRNIQFRLKHLQQDEIPRAFQPSFTCVLNGCSDICKRVGDILAGCGEDGDPKKYWPLESASNEVRQLQLVLEQGRRTIEIVDGALDLNHIDDLSADIDVLRGLLISGPSPLFASITSCLDAVESYASRNAALIKSDTPLTSSPVSPSIQEMIMSFRRSSLRDWEADDLASHAAGYSDEPQDDDTIYLPPYNVGTGKSVAKFKPRPERWSLDSQELKPSPLRLDHKTLAGETPSTLYTLFPPTSPPPVKALPPIPPPRSSKRPLTTSALVPTHVPSIPPPHSVQPRQRAHSDLENGAELPSSSAAAAQFLGSAKSSTIPIHYTYQTRRSSSPEPDNSTEYSAVEVEIVPLRRLDADDMENFHGSVYSVDTSAKSTLLASRHGKFHIRLWDLRSCTALTTIKVSFYIQIQPRSRDYFVRSHAILSETLNLIGITTGFGHTLEVWNWSRRKKIQTINNALRWAAVRSDVYESRYRPLATYSEDDNTIKLYPVSRGKKPFGKPRIIDLRKARLPHLPKMPELAFSATGPLLVAAAGPRPPRPGNPPPNHAALLMAWQLDGDESIHSPYKFFETMKYPEIENSLPLCLETYGSVAVSIWESAKFRTIGKPGSWQVEPVTVSERVVLVWDFSGPFEKTTTYSIPAVLACVSPDCRFVAYCDPGGRNGGDADGALVVLDATRTGRELWRLEALGRDFNTTAADSRRRRSSRWNRLSSDTARSGHRSDRSSIHGVEGLELLASNLEKVTELTFSSDGSQLLVGDTQGGIGVYEFRLEGLHMTSSSE